MRIRLSAKLNQALLLAAILANVFAFGQLSPPEGQHLETQLTNRELALVEAERKHDTAAFNQLLDDQLIYVAINGWVFTKHENSGNADLRQGEAVNVIGQVQKAPTFQEATQDGI